jgi:hypothetical protein
VAQLSTLGIMAPRRKIIGSTIFTIVWLAMGVFVFCYYPMPSAFHHPTTQRTILASAFFVCIVLNIVFLWCEPKSKFDVATLNRVLGFVGMLLVLWYS